MARRIITWAVAFSLLPFTAIAADKGILGALIGAGAGAAIGHSINRKGGSGKGAIIGALGGYFIGKQMEKSNTDEPERDQNRYQNTVLDCRNLQYELNQANQTAGRDERVFLLQNTAKKCPQSARIHNDLGVAYYERNHAHDKERARLELEEALRIDPGYIEAKRNLDYL